MMENPGDCTEQYFTESLYVDLFISVSKEFSIKRTVCLYIHVLKYFHLHFPQNIYILIC